MTSLRNILYALGLIACAFFATAMVTAQEAHDRMIAQWGFVGIAIAMLVGLAIRGDDDRQP